MPLVMLSKRRMLTSFQAGYCGSHLPILSSRDSFPAAQFQDRRGVNDFEVPPVWNNVSCAPGVLWQAPTFPANRSRDRDPKADRCEQSVHADLAPPSQRCAAYGSRRHSRRIMAHAQIKTDSGSLSCRNEVNRVHRSAENDRPLNFMLLDPAAPDLAHRRHHPRTTPNSRQNISRRLSRTCYPVRLIMIYSIMSASSWAAQTLSHYSAGRSYHTRPSFNVIWVSRRRFAVIVSRSLSVSSKSPSRSSNTEISALAPGRSVPTVPS